MTEPKADRSWVQEHKRLYLETGGAVGHLWDATGAGGRPDTPSLLLTTKGRKSGKEQMLPLFYGHTPEGFVVIASKGGAPEHPDWYLNLQANPEVQVQVLDRKFKARARTATGAERQKLWDHMVEVFAPYTGYQEKTKREIPVVVLEAQD